jgi:glutamine cyclotransferase
VATAVFHAYPAAPLANSVSTPTFGYTVIRQYPHDPNAFTQGLIYLDGVLYEGTGLYGQSSLRRVDLETGDVAQIVSLPEEYFGEGVTVLGDKIYQLTWENQTGFIYDRDAFEQTGTFTYPTEGWGLTHDGERLIMSNGSDALFFLDPETLEVNGRLPVYDEHGPVARLNELEYIDGSVYANVWQTNRIARIDPQTGQVTAWIDLSGLLPADQLTQPVDVLNGIAWDGENGRLFVTGKLWPTLFEIQLVEAAYP